MKYIVIISTVLAFVAGCAPQDERNGALTPSLPQAIPAVKFQTIYEFPEAASPDASLLNVGGIFYGTTTVGGSDNAGTVYSVTPGGTEKTLYSFKSGNDGATPRGGLIAVKGTLYGTTYSGGGSGCKGYGPGCGTVFSISRDGVEHVLYRFSGTDGAHPNAGLIDVGGTLYGTTYYGGTGICSTKAKAAGCGTVFSITTSGTENVIYAFSGEPDGEYPDAPLTRVDGALYGTTYLGGLDAQGTVFRIDAAGNEKIVHSFGAGTDGARPQSGLLNVNGTLYGTTSGGGARTSMQHFYDQYGTVFSITSRGAEIVLHSFGKGRDGRNPEAGVIDFNGNLFGTTVGGGTRGNGTVFSLSLARKEKVLYRFRNMSDGAQPNTALIEVDGTLYGTTETGGIENTCCGTVFSLTDDEAR